MAINISKNNNGTLTVSFTFTFDEMLERLHAHISLLNHDLAPDPDNDAESVSWNENLDRALVRFSTVAAASLVKRAAGGWNMSLETLPDAVRLSIQAIESTRRFTDLIHRQIDDIIYHYNCAERLTLSAPSLRTAVRLIRDEHRNRTDRTLQDLKTTLILLD